MNVDAILNRAINMLLRRGINAGINKGTQMLASRGKNPAEMTEAERAQQAQLKEKSGQARQFAKLIRRTR